MSANISYRQVKPIDGISLPVFAPSSFMESIRTAIGEFPCLLGKKHIPILKGMAAMCTDGAIKDFGNPYESLIDAIENLGAVEVYAEY